MPHVSNQCGYVRLTHSNRNMQNTSIAWWEFGKDWINISTNNHNVGASDNGMLHSALAESMNQRRIKDDVYIRQ